MYFELQNIRAQMAITRFQNFVISRALVVRFVVFVVCRKRVNLLQIISLVWTLI